MHHADSGLGNTGAQSDTCIPRKALAYSSRGRRSRHQSSMFRNRGSLIRTINLNYSDRSSTTIRQQELNTTMHITVLKVLEQFATRYQVRERLAKAETRMHSWGLGKTGTIDTTGLLRLQEEIQQQEEIDTRGYPARSCRYTGYFRGKRRKR